MGRAGQILLVRELQRSVLRERIDSTILLAKQVKAAAIGDDFATKYTCHIMKQLAVGRTPFDSRKRDFIGKLLIHDNEQPRRAGGKSSGSLQFRVI